MKTDAAVLSVMVIATLLFIPVQALALSPEAVSVSRNGHFRVQIQSSLQSVALNQIHHWTVYLQDVAGNSVADASIEVTGRMPAHDHGLPTQPRARAADGEGKYLIEGLRFHMPGEWQLEMDISASGTEDSLVITFEL
ncbi:auxin-binding protein [Proteobacteria bacterium 005FR1]|nr:auxin-binding protein [Proteobacteria bacterium 005FR1]